VQEDAKKLFKTGLQNLDKSQILVEKIAKGKLLTNPEFKSTKSPGGTKTHGSLIMMVLDFEVPEERNETNFKNAQNLRIWS